MHATPQAPTTRPPTVSRRFVVTLELADECSALDLQGELAQALGVSHLGPASDMEVIPMDTAIALQASARDRTAVRALLPAPVVAGGA